MADRAILRTGWHRRGAYRPHRGAAVHAAGARSETACTPDDAGRISEKTQGARLVSNAAAIAAVTSTLYNLLDKGIRSDTTIGTCTVTTDPPDSARGARTDNQINLFLYQLAFSAAWRNIDMPRQVHPGETGQPPLGLNLYYLLTAYGAQTELYMGHRILGQAMSILHDHPLLGSKEIQDNAIFSDLYLQVERVRITPQPLSIEDITKLWTSFQTNYRLSAAYEVSVVLIESQRPARTPLPVLSRGAQDEGALAQADLVPPFPAIDALVPPNGQPAARLGDAVTIRGHHLDGTAVVVRLEHPRLLAPIDVPPVAGGAESTVSLQPPPPHPPPAGWAPGDHAAAGLCRVPEGARPMTSAQEWQERTAHFLSQALAWIRLALEAHGQRSTAGQEAEPAGAPPPISDDDLAAQRAAADAAAQAMEPAPPLVQLAGYFRLSRFEQDLLFLCAAMELDTRLPALCAAAQGDPELRYPTFALALSLFPDPAWDVLSPERPLRYWRLLEIIQPQGRPLTSSALHIDERIANYIKGLNYFDDRLAALVTPIEQSVEDLHLPSQRPGITQVIQALRQHAGERPPVLQLVGADQASKHAVALAVATQPRIHP